MHFLCLYLKIDGAWKNSEPIDPNDVCFSLMTTNLMKNIGFFICEVCQENDKDSGGLLGWLKYKEMFL